MTMVPPFIPKHKENIRSCKERERKTKQLRNGAKHTRVEEETAKT